MALTKAHKEKYLKKGGVRCPYCNSDNINTIGSLLEKYGKAAQDVQCLSCGKMWIDIYTLSDVEE